MNTSTNTKGFTLIEIMVVIAIIGMLASVVLSSMLGAREKARYATAKTEMRQIANLIVAARLETGKTTAQVTGSYCSECVCRTGTNIQNLSRSHSCWTDYQDAITALNTATAGGMSLNALPVDPWGGPYLIDENEGESGYPVNTCYTDNVASAGPNGLYYDTDDIVYNISVGKCTNPQGGHQPDVNWP